MRWVCAILNSEGEILATFGGITGLGDEDLKRIFVEVAEEAVSEGVISRGNLGIIGFKAGEYRVLVVLERKGLGLRLLLRKLSKAVEGIKEPSSLLEVVNRCMEVKLFEPEEVMAPLKKAVSKALELEEVRYSLQLRGEILPMQASFLLMPYRISNFENGMKRAIAAAFVGDIVDAYRLAISALSMEKKAVAAIAAAYFGYQLFKFPGRYPAPDIESLLGILNETEPENDLEKKLFEFLKVAVEGLENYDKYLMASDMLKKMVDELFSALQSESVDQFLKDIIAYILITYEPSLLTAQKVERLLLYIEQRSMLLGSYLRAALDRLRSFAIMLAKEIPWKDVVGQIRMLKTRYLNFRVDLNEFVKKYELNMAFRRARELLVGSFLSLTEYLRLIYWSMGMKEARYEDLTEFLPSALYEAAELIRMVVEATPPLEVSSIVDSAYFASLIARIAGTYEKDEAEMLVRNAVIATDALIDLLQEGGRRYTELTIKLILLLWAHSCNCALIKDISVLLVRILRDWIEDIERALKQMREVSAERYMMMSHFLLNIALSIAGLVSVSDEERMGIAEMLMESLLNFIKLGAFLPQFAIPAIDALKLCSESTSDESIRRRLVTMVDDIKKGLSKEDISPIIKNALAMH